MTCIKTIETEGRGKNTVHMHTTHTHTRSKHAHERNGRKLDAGFREGTRGKKS